MTGMFSRCIHPGPCPVDTPQSCPPGAGPLISRQVPLMCTSCLLCGEHQLSWVLSPGPDTASQAWTVSGLSPATKHKSLQSWDVSETSLLATISIVKDHTESLESTISRCLINHKLCPAWKQVFFCISIWCETPMDLFIHDMSSFYDMSHPRYYLKK